MRAEAERAERAMAAERAEEALRQSTAAAVAERLAREHAEQRAQEERQHLTVTSEAERAALQQQVQLAEAKRAAVCLPPQCLTHVWVERLLTLSRPWLLVSNLHERIWLFIHTVCFLPTGFSGGAAGNSSTGRNCP